MAIEIRRILVNLGFEETDVRARYFQTDIQKQPKEMNYTALTKSNVTSIVWDGENRTWDQPHNLPLWCLHSPGLLTPISINTFFTQ